MWIWDAPSSTARRASAAYSSGVYGIAGHWSRLASTPLIEQLMITGSSKLLISPPPSLDRHYAVAFPWLLDLLVARHPQGFDDRRPGLARVDDFVDHRVAGG